VSDEQQHMALPRLYGGPAYSRPARPAQDIVRPFDPDELPLEADRTEIDQALASELAGATWSAPTPPPAKTRKARRGRAAAQSAVGVAATGRAQGGASPENGDRHAVLQGRPFSLRGLGRIFGGDRK
jgi:hypothetical protein